MVTFKKMWDSFIPIIKDKIMLDIGVGFAPTSYPFLKYPKSVDRISINPDSFETLEKLPNVKYKVMNAKNLDYSNEYFDVILVSSSFHEFDPTIQEKALEEMVRVLKRNGYLILIEPKPESVTNELFKVFDPNEDHAKRIVNSMEKLEKFISKFKIIDKGESNILSSFNSIKERNETILQWWSDIKIPKNETEKEQMVKQINCILGDNLIVEEPSIFLILQK